METNFFSIKNSLISSGKLKLIKQFFTDNRLTEQWNIIFHIQIVYNLI